MVALLAQVCPSAFGSQSAGRHTPLAQLVPAASAVDPADEETDGRSLSTVVVPAAAAVDPADEERLMVALVAQVLVNAAVAIRATPARCRI
jgi:hypothetical protein